jgi:FtsZ-binding cell division protein ZapB
MDLLKQLEAKMQALVQQRNQLKDELDALKAGGAQELQSLRDELAESEARNAALEKDREAVKDQVAAILRALEALG